jgi:hypothetical protein
MMSATAAYSHFRMKLPVSSLSAIGSLAAILAMAPLIPLPAQESPEPAMKEISPGVFQIGKLRLDKNKRTVSFPARVNQNRDLIEYVLVTPDGATHESLLTAEIQPNDLHFAMLLLGAKGAGILMPQADHAPPGQIDAEYLKTAPRMKGDNLTITAAWKDGDGKERTAQVEEWLMHTETKAPVAKGPWIYTGSMYGADGGFLAQQQSIFICVVTNPAALINNPRSGNDNDRIWAVNPESTPPVDTPLELTFKLEDGTSDTK